MYFNNTIRKVEDDILSSLYNVEGSAYDRKAKMYEKLVSLDFYNKLIWGTLPNDYTEFANASIRKGNGRNIDIGCGGLIQTSGIYADIKQEFILLDHSIEMLKIARKRLIGLCGKVPENISLLQADAFNLPFENDSFDNLVCFGMIHCFENKEAFINESLRVIKTGGSFHFSTMTSDRAISKLYMKILRKQKEFGEPLSSKQMLTYFKGTTELNYYMKGSMLFISGCK